MTDAPRENFWVLSPFLARELRPHFAAVYRFCRAADDVADEHPHTPESTRHALDQLAEWHRYLNAIHAAPPHNHPVFTPLAHTIRERGLNIDLFHALLDAFEQDQQQSEYGTWSDLIAYCRRSADPVGRLVLELALGPKGATPHQITMSDATCTALQIVNHLQDCGRDLRERRRVYLPSELTGLDADDLQALLDAGPTEPAVARFDRAIAPILERTRRLIDHGAPLAATLPRSIDRPVMLFHHAADLLLRRIGDQRGTTLWQRPRVGTARKLAMLLHVVARPRPTQHRRPSPAVSTANVNGLRR